MATTKELQAFLKKRGYETTVEKEDETYVVSIRSQTVDEVAKLLASIDEPGRFVVSVQLSDILDLLKNSTRSEIADFSNSLATLRELVDNTARKFESSNNITRERVVVSEHKMVSIITGLDDRITKLETKRWWKRGK